MDKKLLTINILGVCIVVLLLCEIAWVMPAFYETKIKKRLLYKKCISNETAIEEAMKDIKEGKLYILLNGLLDKDFVDELMEKEQKYGFKIIGLGCVGGPKPLYIYDQIMRRKVNEIAGKYVFRTFDIYTLEEYRQQNGTNHKS